MTSSSSSMDGSSTSNDNNIENPQGKVSYRKARIEDLPRIVDLLERSFPEDNDDANQDEERRGGATLPASSSSSQNTNDNNAWSWNPFSKNNNSKNKQQEQLAKQEPLDETQKLIQLLEQRLTLPQHILLVATVNNNNNNNDDDKVVGFMELGTMPAPIPISVPVNVPAAGQTTSEASVSFVPVRPERPFLANLAVDPDYRKQKMGSKLVQLALKIATQWESAKANDKNKGGAFYYYYFHPSNQENAEQENKLSTLYLSVECDNEGAIAFYERLQFTTVLDETNPRFTNSDDRDATSASPSGSASASPSASRSTSASANVKKSKSKTTATRRPISQRKPKLYLEKVLVLSIDT
ncbi:MAG: hypothetical protein SGBAC_012187 [Bacillariaceae sp.]